MLKKQIGLKRFVATCGLITMSSSISSQSFTAMDMGSDYYYKTYNYSFTDKNICNSSMLSKQAIGDIPSFEKKADFVKKHENINVNLQITKISKHVSHFDFEEEFEEI